MQRELQWIVRQNKPYARLVAVSFGCIVLAALMAVLDPLIMKWIIDKVLPAKNVSLLFPAALIFLLTYWSRLGFLAWGKILNFRAVQSMTFKVRLKVFRHLQNLSADYYDQAPVGDIMFRVEQDIGEIATVGGEFALSFVRIVTATTLIITTMAILNLRLTCVILPLVPIYLLLRRRYQSGLQHWSQAVQAKSGERSSFLQENFAANVQLQLLRRQTAHARKFFELSRVAFNAVMRRRTTELFFGTLASLIIVLGIAVLLGYGGYLVTRNAISIGGLVAFYSYVMRLFDPISEAVDIDMRLQRIRASIRRILEILDVHPSIADRPGAAGLPETAAGVVELRDVSFSYRDRKEVLSRVQFRINPGEKVALVGKTGSGKSTIGKLISRLYDVSGGAICLDGQDIRNLFLRDVRSSVALMLQDPVLFDATLRENLLAGNPSASQQELDAAAELAQIDRLVEKLPRGWQEVLGPKAIRLSGGERQRIALARTILQRPRVLILDEATSALDAETEKNLLNALDDFASNRTTILISHRLSAILWADRILVLDQGRIVEEGTHSQLYNKGGYYRSIYEEELQKEDRAPAHHVSFTTI